MNIILMEGDELAQPDGKPKNIYLSINGKKMILPTSKTILDLLDIGKGIEPSKEPIVESASIETQEMPIAEVPVIPVDHSIKIQREDLVKCVMVNERLAKEDKSDLTLGTIYRVIKISQMGITNPDTQQMEFIVDHYEVIEDNAPVPRRIYAFPGEVELYQKSKRKKIGKDYKFSEVMKCECGTSNALILDEAKNKYTGICANPDCQKELEMERPKKK